MINCTAYGNTGADGSVLNLINGCYESAVFANNNFWGNQAPSVYDGECGIDNHHNNLDSDIAGVGGPGPGDIRVDPLFVNPDDPDFANVDLSLDPASPVIDQGDNTIVQAQQDIAGNPRIVDGDGSGTDEVDMGAYEYQGD
jgi:hypothetical protein